MARHLSVAMIWLLAVAMTSGHPYRAMRRPAGPRATLRTDSAQYTVHLIGPLYRTNIGYEFTNHTHDVVSAGQCREPDPPVLERDMGNGRWVLAYRTVALTCKSPPFRIGAGATYRGRLLVAAARPGVRMVPAFHVDSVPGIYRLRWVFSAGPDPDQPGVGLVEAISAPFRLIVR